MPKLALLAKTNGAKKVLKLSLKIFTSFLRSIIVDSRPIDALPPSSIYLIFFPKSSLTSEEQTALTFDDKLALAFTEDTYEVMSTVDSKLFGLKIINPTLSTPIIGIPFFIDNVTEKVLKLRDSIGNFETLTYVGIDWKSPHYAKKSIELLATKVLPKVNKHLK